MQGVLGNGVEKRGREMKMYKCPYCNMDTAGNHELLCPSRLSPDDPDYYPVKLAECEHAPKPYKCPICDGVGLVSGGYYNRAGDRNTWASNKTTEECKVCQGTGIIWG